MSTLETLRKNENLPMPDWGKSYLAALDQNEGYHGKSVKVMGLSWSQVFLAKQKCEQFARVVEEIREKWRGSHLDQLENISMEQAKKPGCITERIFRMKQLDPTYRDKQGVAGSGGIRVVFGFDMGDKKPRKEITANFSIEEGKL